MIQVQAIKPKTLAYKEIIQVNVPIRFYWCEDGFDGVEFGPFEEPLCPWEEDMLLSCLDALVEEE